MSAAADGLDPDAVFRRYERRLRAWLARRVTASPALVEDACAGAWLIFVARRPNGERVFGWLCTVALHEAYRLSRQQRREPASELGEQQPALVPARRDDLDTALEAKWALEAVASLRERERRYMAWQAAGYRYEEMQQLAGGATSTNVNKHLTRARGRLRQLAEQEGKRDAPRAENQEKGGFAVATGSCRRCGQRPRRMRGGRLEPLCEQCRREALDKVAGELAAEPGPDGRARLRRAGPRPAGRPADRPPERVAPVARVGAGQIARARRGPRPRVGDELLREARRLYALGLSLRAVAETLLAQTGYASAQSAEVALRAQFKRRGWPLRNRAQAQRTRHTRNRDEKRRAA